MTKKGEFQCVAIVDATGDRCENTVFFEGLVCGVHSRASGIETVLEEENE